MGRRGRLGKISDAYQLNPSHCEARHTHQQGVEGQPSSCRQLLLPVGAQAGEQRHKGRAQAKRYQGRYAKQQKGSKSVSRTIIGTYRR